MDGLVRRALVAGTLASALAVAACGGDDVDLGDASPPTTEPVDSGYRAGDGTTTTAADAKGASADVPDHLPVDLAPGGQVDTVADPTEGTLQDYWYVRVLYPEDDAEDVVMFYDDLLADLGFLEEKVSSQPGNARWLTTQESGVVTMKVDTGQTHFAGYAVLEIGWNES